MSTVKASIGFDKYLTTNVAGTNTLYADEPIELGGTNRGFNPNELLASALASCTCITLRMYANRKEWPMDGLDVEVDVQRGIEPGTTMLKRKIQLKGNLSEEQHTRLIQIANQCPIHKLLSNTIEIKTELI